MGSPPARPADLLQPSAADPSHLCPAQLELIVEKNILAEHLEAIIHDHFQPPARIDTDTPIDKTLDLLNDIIMGQMPSIHDTLELYNMITQAGFYLSRLGHTAVFQDGACKASPASRLFDDLLWLVTLQKKLFRAALVPAICPQPLRESCLLWLY